MKNYKEITNTPVVIIKINSTYDNLCSARCRFFTMDYGLKQCVLYHDLGSKKHELKNNQRCTECILEFL